ncbi:hypothetical protein HDU86_000712 [Geranomyces michiganensis]|nr:hypothetical protein HDU86_000712 [Geranomyces michiganensis]
MGNCCPTALSVCPWSRWAHSTGRGYPSHPTFDYDEIDDLEIENLLNMPSPFPSSSRRGGGPSGAIWEKVAALFRRPEHPRVARGGVESGGYQSVPTDNDAAGIDAPFAAHPPELDDDEFLWHEADAQLLSDDHIRQITSFAAPQPVHSEPQIQELPEVPVVPPSPVIDPRDPLAGFLSLQSAGEQLIHHDPPQPPSPTPTTTSSQPPAPRPYNVGDGSFRPKKRTSAAASSAVSAAAMFGSAPSSSPPRDERGADGSGSG